MGGSESSKKKNQKLTKKKDLKKISSSKKIWKSKPGMHNFKYLVRVKTLITFFERGYVETGA